MVVADAVTVEPVSATKFLRLESFWISTNGAKDRAGTYVRRAQLHEAGSERAFTALWTVGIRREITT